MKTVYSHESINTDHTTGEIVSTQKTVVKKVTSREFIKVYTEDISNLHKLSSLEAGTLHYCFKCCGYDNKVTLLKEDKEKIALMCNASLDSVYNTISKLNKLGWLKMVSRSRYILNPNYFWKGDETSNSAATFEFRLRYEINSEE